MPARGPVLLGVGLMLGVCGSVVGDGEQSASAAGAEQPGAAAHPPLGPVRVRPFEPMVARPVCLEGRHGPVYFRSPLAEPAACDRSVDRSVDRNVPLACGLAVTDWLVFTFRVLGFPVEMGLRPPWRDEPLSR